MGLEERVRVSLGKDRKGSAATERRYGFGTVRRGLFRWGRIFISSKGGVNMRTNSFLNKEQNAYLVGLMKDLEAQHGVVDAAMIVEDARNPESPLHGVFEWDDTEAARKYRVHQARMMISQVRVNVEHREAPAFYNVTTTIGNAAVRGYVSAETVVNDEEIYQAVLGKAARELRYFQQKYKTIKELRDVINEDALVAMEQAAGQE